MKLIDKLLALLLAVMLLPLSAAADQRITTTDELQTYLTQCREQELKSFVISVPAELGKELTADNKAALNRLMLLAGVEKYDVRVSRNTKLTFSGVNYGSEYVAECDSLEAVRSAVADFLQQDATEITLLCTEEVFRVLYRELGMYHLMAELGVDEFRLQGNGLNMIFLSNIEPFAVPYATVASVSEAGEKIAAWREELAPAFNLVFDDETYQSLNRDAYRLMTFLGGAEKYQLTYSNSARTLYFTEVSYTDIPGVYCQSEDEVIAAIYAMGENGCTSFQLMLDAETYNKVNEDNFKRLYELEAQAGMVAGDLRYSGVSNMLLFDNAIINVEAALLPTQDEVTAPVELAD